MAIQLTPDPNNYTMHYIPPGYGASGSTDSMAAISAALGFDVRNAAAQLVNGGNVGANPQTIQNYLSNYAMTMAEALDPTRLGGLPGGFERQIGQPSQQLFNTYTGMVQPYIDAVAKNVLGRGSLSPDSGVYDAQVMAQLYPVMAGLAMSSTQPAVNDLMAYTGLQRALGMNQVEKTTNLANAVTLAGINAGLAGLRGQYVQLAPQPVQPSQEDLARQQQEALYNAALYERANRMHQNGLAQTSGARGGGGGARGGGGGGGGGGGTGVDPAVAAFRDWQARTQPDIAGRTPGNPAYGLPPTPGKELPSGYAPSVPTLPSGGPWAGGT